MDSNFQSTRYYLDEIPLQQPYPWSYGYAWNRSAALYAGSDAYFIAKLEIGGLQFAQPGLTKLFKATKSGWLDVTQTVLSGATNFQITREILVADLNADGFDDFFLNNHGVEPPGGMFPGEKNAIYLYDKNTDKFVETLTPYMDFSHGSSIGDFDADGRLDIFVNNLGAVEQIPSYLLKQSASGTFTRVDLSPSLQTSVGPLTAALDVGNDGIWDLATTAVNEKSFVVWSNILAANPTRFASNDLPMPVSGVFEIVSSDFDGDGKSDVLVVGNDTGLHRAAFYFSAGTASQELVQPLVLANINDFVTGGIRVFVNDLDKNGTQDVQLHTNLSDWSGLRILIFFDLDRNPTVVRMKGNTNGVYVDQNGDGVVDFVTEDAAHLNTYLGRLKEPFDEPDPDPQPEPEPDGPQITTVYDSAGLYLTDVKQVVVDSAGLNQGADTVSPIGLKVGTKPFAPKVAPSALLRYDDGSFGVLSDSGSVWTEQRFGIDGVASGKAVKLTLPSLLALESQFQKDINGDTLFGDTRFKAIDTDGYGVDGTAAPWGLFVTGLLNAYALDFIDLPLGQELGQEAVLLRLNVKKLWTVKANTEILGIAERSSGDIEVLLKTGIALSAQTFDADTGMAIGKAVKLKAGSSEITAREAYYGLELDATAGINLIGVTEPPLGW